MNGFTFFQYDRATKLHFTVPDYDVFSSRGKVKGVTFENFLRKKDHESYNKVSDKFNTDLEAIQYLASNYAYKNPSPIHNFAEGENNFITWKKRKQSLTNTFSSDIDTLVLYGEKKDLSFEQIKSVNGGMPDLFKLYLGGNITIETLHIIDAIDPYLAEWKNSMLQMWHKDLLIIGKLHKFVRFDEEKMKKLYLELS